MECNGFQFKIAKSKPYSLGEENFDAFREFSVHDLLISHHSNVMEYEFWFISGNLIH